MNWNTFRTTFGFVGTLIEKYTPMTSSKPSADSVFNYLKLSDRLATSGQPSRAQFESIRREGYTTIINLLPHDHENALPGEEVLMGELGFAYIYIPVDFKKPHEEEFEAFCEAMDQTEGEQVWVHCAANMRVSAFLYRYRVERLGGDEAACRAEMETIWTPFGAWKSFVWKGDPSATPDSPNARE
ncbi:MAG: protein tyrosine phosphatase family protein [Pseudomonadota bacterium]